MIGSSRSHEPSLGSPCAGVVRQKPPDDKLHKLVDMLLGLIIVVRYRIALGMRLAIVLVRCPGLTMLLGFTSIFNYRLPEV